MRFDFQPVVVVVVVVVFVPHLVVLYFLFSRLEGLLSLEAVQQHPRS